MKKQEVIIVGIVILIALCITLGFWFKKTIPNTEEIDSETHLVQPVDKDILTNKNAKEIDALKIFGNIPVESQDKYHNNNPFL